MASGAAAFYLIFHSFFYYKILSILGRKIKVEKKSPVAPFSVTRPLNRKHTYFYGQPIVIQYIDLLKNIYIINHIIIIINILLTTKEVSTNLCVIQIIIGID